MKPHPRHQSLFFTPRTPWGTRLTGRTFHDHMHASEDAPGQQSPSMLSKAGHWVKENVLDHMYFGTDLEKNSNEPISGQFGAGFQYGAKGPKSFASDEVDKETRSRMVNQRRGIYVPADGEANTHQASPDHVTTDQEMEKAQREWAERHPKEIKQGADTSIANFYASEADRKARTAQAAQGTQMVSPKLPRARSQPAPSPRNFQ